MEAKAPNEMDQDRGHKRGREESEHTAHTAHSQISAKEEERSAKEQESRRVEIELASASGTEVRSELEAKVQFLREETESIRQQIMSRDQQIISLWEETKSLRVEMKSLRSVQAAMEQEYALVHGRQISTLTSGGSTLDCFVRSAAKQYSRWEQAVKAVGKARKAGVEEEGHARFLVVNDDPFEFFSPGFLIWVRKCYKDLKKIMAEAKPGKKFVLLGTPGIGKSLFTVFWICYRATLREKLVWRLGGDYYLLDFSQETSSSQVVFGPFNACHPFVQQVFVDPDAWLIIDGGYKGTMLHSCHVLLACSREKDNYHEFSKNPNCRIQYLPVWTKEEIEEFVDDFEELRPSYSHMCVPEKEKVFEYFQQLGGVPRYVLCANNTEQHLNHDFRDAIRYLHKETCLDYLAGKFVAEDRSDCLVHISCRDGNYSDPIYDIASLHVKEHLKRRFPELSRVDVVDFLQRHA